MATRMNTRLQKQRVVARIRLTNPDSPAALCTWRPTALRTALRRRSDARIPHRIQSKRRLTLERSWILQSAKNRRIRPRHRVALSMWPLRTFSDPSDASGNLRDIPEPRRQVGDMSSLAQTPPRHSRERRGEPRAQPSCAWPWPLVAEPRVGAHRARSTAAIRMATCERFK
jgi:hypothetical protein